MIKNFADKHTLRIATGQHSRSFPVKIQQRARLCMERLDAAASLADLQQFPAMRLKRLKGQRSHQYSVRVNDQYRIIFSWSDGQASNVQLLDYH